MTVILLLLMAERRERIADGTKPPFKITILVN